MKLEDSGEYDISLAVWSPDYPDPISYLDMFVTNGTQNKTGYSNPKYDEFIQKAKTDTKDLQARWNNLLEVEKNVNKRRRCYCTNIPKRICLCYKRWCERHYSNFLWW